MGSILGETDVPTQTHGAPSENAGSSRNALAGARLAFVGAGVMAEAMIAGLLDRKLIAPDRITVSHPREDRRQRLVERYGVIAVEANREAAGEADLVFLTIKPQILATVMKQLH